MAREASGGEIATCGALGDSGQRVCSRRNVLIDALANARVALCEAPSTLAAPAAAEGL